MILFSIYIFLNFLYLVLCSGFPPQFTNLNKDTIIYVSENTHIYSTVFTLIASDHEADNLTYGKNLQEPINPDFPLNTKTGELYFPRFYEDYILNFTFIFDVSDGTSTIDSNKLTIIINDINNNYPYFNKDLYVFDICLENFIKDKDIYNIKAYDKDTNSILSYTISDSDFIFKDDKIIFYGNIVKNFYNITLKASDGTYGCYTIININVIYCNTTDTIINTTINNLINKKINIYLNPLIIYLIIIFNILY